MPRKRNPHSKQYVKPDYHSQNKLLKEQKANNNTESVNRKKKFRLRSSMDIYHRLMHDETLDINLNHVMIGYSDNVLGDQEMCVKDWVLIDKGGDIPMHHILYFSLIPNDIHINENVLMLWDRKNKLDRLYCSGITKKQQSLKNIIKKYPMQFKQIQQQNNDINDNDEYDNIDNDVTDDDNKNDDDEYNEEQETKNDSNYRMPKQIHIEDEMVQKYFPRYPITNDGFVESFEINDYKTWKKYLNEYGLVVLKVFKPKECDKTIQSMFDEIYQRTLEIKKNKNDMSTKTYKIDINNPFTWNGWNFPKPYNKFLTDRPAFSTQSFKNRCSKKMYFIFKTLYENEKLNVTIDNWGIQRGTKNLIFKDPKTNKKIINCHLSEQEKWRKNLVPHWDINPWSYLHWLSSGYYENIYQGAVALSEQRLCDGTHLTLPGCKNYIQKWCDQNKKENIKIHRHTMIL